MRSTKKMCRSIISLLLAALVLLLVTACNKRDGGNASGTPAAAVNPEPLRGKSINFIIPLAAGGGFDRAARLVAPFLEKYTGATLVPRNIEGAAGVVGSNQAYRARADGTTISIISGTGNVLSQLVGLEGVLFDMTKQTTIGRFSTDDEFIFISAKSKYNTLDKLLEAARTGSDFIVLSEGAEGSPHFRSVLAVEVLGLTGTRILTGYQSSSELNLAMIRGDGDMTAGTYTSRQAQIDAGDFIPMISLSKERSHYFPDVPTIYEVNKDQANIPLIDFLVGMDQLGRVVVGPPDMDEAAKVALQQAFKQACEDPELLANAAKAQMPVAYLEPAGVEAMVNAILNAPPEVKTRLNAALDRFKRE